jgi:hypothetical protein
MLVVPKPFYPLTIFHKRKSQPYYFEDSFRGIAYAAKRGATAIDLDCTITKDKVIIVNHWEDIAKGHFVDPHHVIPKHAKVSNLTWDEVSRLENHQGYKIRRAVDAIAYCKSKKIIPCFEVKGDKRFENPETYKQLHDASIAHNWPIIIMTLPHVGGKQHGYKRLAAAQEAGLNTMVLVNVTKFGRGFVPTVQWKYLDFIKGPLSWTSRGRPASVKRLGPGSKYGTSVGAGNARSVTRRLRKKWK